MRSLLTRLIPCLYSVHLSSSRLQATDDSTATFNPHLSGPMIAPYPSVTLQPIGLVRSCWPEKFGIPRQPGQVEAATATLELFPPFNREEMFRGLESFSHVWLVFLFHGTVAEGWKPTVRPPRLGGQRRVGVFASRSPHRPNHLGLSVVRLSRMVVEGGAVRLELAGVDLLDGTPVLDIKPYVPYADSLPGASDGFTAEEAPLVAVRFTSQSEQFCQRYQQQTGRDLHQLVVESLARDPRPASQRRAAREHGARFWDVHVRWRQIEEGFEVFSCERVRE